MKTKKQVIELFLYISMGFPDSSVGKESACSAGDPGAIPGFGRSPGKGKGYPLQDSGLQNSVDCVVHGVTKSWTRLSDFDFKWDMMLGTYSQYLRIPFPLSGSSHQLHCNDFVSAGTQCPWTDNTGVTSVRVQNARSHSRPAESLPVAWDSR